MHTIIVGGGIMGLMYARLLGKQGHPILLLEKDADLGTEASWAGGGICMPVQPWAYPPIVQTLIKRGVELYQDLSKELLWETGIDIEWRQTGLLLLDNKHFTQALRWAEQNDYPIQYLSASSVQQSFPVINAAKNAFWLPTIYQLRNPRLLKALKKSVLSLPNVKSITNCEVKDFIQSGNHIDAVKTNQGIFSSEKIVLTPGAWTSTLLEKIHNDLKIYPVRGQILLWKAPSDLLANIVIDGEYYLIPRADGHILVGGTLEQVGFDNSTTKNAYNDIYNAAITLVPQLRDYPVERHWSGLRPGSSHGIPFIGRVDGIDNLWVNAGHYRNGLVMAPAATEALMDIMSLN